MRQCSDRRGTLDTFAEAGASGIGVPKQEFGHEVVVLGRLKTPCRQASSSGAFVRRSIPESITK